MRKGGRVRGRVSRARLRVARALCPLARLANLLGQHSYGRGWATVGAAFLFPALQLNIGPTFGGENPFAELIPTAHLAPIRIVSRIQRLEMATNVSRFVLPIEVLVVQNQPKFEAGIG